MKKPRPPLADELQITRVDLSPGDVAVVKVHHLLTVGDAEHVRDHVSRFLPRGVSVLVLDSNADISVLRSGRELPLTRR